MGKAGSFVHVGDPYCNIYSNSTHRHYTTYVTKDQEQYYE